MKDVTDDEHVHDDSSKELPELVENIIKSDILYLDKTEIVNYGF